MREGPATSTSLFETRADWAQIGDHSHQSSVLSCQYLQCNLTTSSFLRIRRRADGRVSGVLSVFFSAPRPPIVRGKIALSHSFVVPRRRADGLLPHSGTGPDFPTNGAVVRFPKSSFLPALSLLARRGGSKGRPLLARRSVSFAGLHSASGLRSRFGCEGRKPLRRVANEITCTPPSLCCGHLFAVRRRSTIPARQGR